MTENIPIDRISFDARFERRGAPKFGRLIRLRRATSPSELPPIVVRRQRGSEERFVVVDGNNRLWLARERGWPRLRATVVPADFGAVGSNLSRGQRPVHTIQPHGNDQE